MEITNDLIDRIAELAKLEFNDSSKQQMKTDLTKMIAFVEKLNQVDTTNVEPLIYINEDVNVLREDEIKQEITQDDALKNAPKKDSDYFKVPKVLEKK
ncbi:MAG: Asp-tRNA(Asn)/Glu-tRNA(Gln) amidotransferase subunit GatC [Bacteroidetes bacterium]|nr:Asp-tRNA(Asn)/Glu-tRNA(Gln) amidotransferase subunit GatC [Bacteroidota bacterium]